MSMSPWLRELVVGYDAIHGQGNSRASDLSSRFCFVDRFGGGAIPGRYGVDRRIYASLARPERDCVFNANCVSDDRKGRTGHGHARSRAGGVDRVKPWGICGAACGRPPPEPGRRPSDRSSHPLGASWVKHLGPDGLEKWKTTNRLEVEHYAEGRTRWIHYASYDDATQYENFATTVTVPALHCAGAFRRCSGPGNSRALRGRAASCHPAVGR